MPDPPQEVRAFGLRCVDSSDPASRVDVHSVHERSLRRMAGDAYDEMLKSPEATSEFLDDSRPQIRRVALALLADHWPRSRDLKSLCEQMAFSDPDVEVRSDAIAHLGGLYSRTSDPRPGRLFAELVRSEHEPYVVRKTAYFALLMIRDRPTESWPDPDAFRVPSDIDWNFVESFFLEPPPRPEDSLPGSIDLPPELRSIFLAHTCGMRAFRDQDYQESVDRFTECLRHGRLSPLPIFMRGCAYGNLGDLDAAIADFTAAIEMKPDYALAYYERAEAYRRKGMPELAEADARRATELDPSLADNE